MSLGIFKRLWDLLENGMKELDLKVACQVTGNGQAGVGILEPMSQLWL